MPTDDVDPRFDPRYQRGYDPSLHPAAARPTVAATASAVAEAPPAPADGPDGAAATAEDAVEYPADRRRDPFSMTLPALAAVCLVAAGWLGWRYVEVSSMGWVQSVAQDDQWIAAIAPLLGPGLLGAGLIALIAWLGLRSLRARG